MAVPKISGRDITLVQRTTPAAVTSRLPDASASRVCIEKLKKLFGRTGGQRPVVWRFGSSLKLKSSTSNKSSFLQPPSESRADLLAKIGNSIQAGPQVILVVAPDHFGKSHTLDELRDHLSRSSPNVILSKDLEPSPAINKILVSPPSQDTVVIVDEVTSWLHNASALDVQTLCDKVKEGGGSLVLAVHQLSEEIIAKFEGSKTTLSAHYLPPLTADEIIPLIDWHSEQRKEYTPKVIRELAEKIRQVSGGYAHIAESIVEFAITYANNSPEKIDEYLASSGLKADLGLRVNTILSKLLRRLTENQKFLYKKIAEAQEGVNITSAEYQVLEPLRYLGLVHVSQAEGGWRAWAPETILTDCLRIRISRGETAYVEEVSALFPSSLDTCIRKAIENGTTLGIYGVSPEQAQQIHALIATHSAEHKKTALILHGDNPSNIADVIAQIARDGEAADQDTSTPNVWLNLRRQISSNQRASTNPGYQPPALVLVFSGQSNSVHAQGQFSGMLMGLMRNSRWEGVPSIVVIETGYVDFKDILAHELNQAGSNWIGVEDKILDISLNMRTGANIQVR